MRIGQVAQLTGLATTTIRYCEDIGLVPLPARAPNGYRHQLRDTDQAMPDGWRDDTRGRRV